MDPIDSTRQPNLANSVGIDDDDERETVFLTEEIALPLGPWWGGGLTALAARMALEHHPAP